jgi:enamine deaminase RidA (YjgF/YER057c/UK114 family)
MSLAKRGRIDRPGSPRIYLASACPQMISVCLTAPTKAGSLAEQTREILEAIDTYLEDFGTDRRALAMAQVWMADIGEIAAFNAVWNDWIDPDHVPALSVVEAQASRRDSLIEIRGYAVATG